MRVLPLYMCVYTLLTFPFEDWHQIFMPQKMTAKVWRFSSLHHPPEHALQRGDVYLWVHVYKCGWRNMPLYILRSLAVEFLPHWHHTLGRERARSTNARWDRITGGEGDVCAGELPWELHRSTRRSIFN